MEQSVIGTETEEARLIERAVSLDGNAFGRLYDMYVDRVYRHIYYRVGKVMDAEDLTQQTFLKAWQAIDRYKKTKSPFLAWLMTISHNLVIDFYRTRKDRAYVDAEIIVDETGPGPEQVIEARFEQQQVRRAILQLTKDQQHVILLRFSEGFRNAEIASILGKSEGAVRVTLHRGLVALRSVLDKEEGQC